MFSSCRNISRKKKSLTDLSLKKLLAKLDKINLQDPYLVLIQIFQNAGNDLTEIM